MKLALLLAAACLGLTGCATIKGWFAPAPSPATVEQPEESSPRAARPTVPSAPRTTPPPAPSAPRTTPPPAPSAPRTTPPLGPDAPLAAPPPAPSAPRAVPPAPVAPRPPAPVAPPPLPDAPPPVLSPVLSDVDEQKLRVDTLQRIDGTEQRLRQIDPAKLPSGQQESLQTAQSFLSKAREALQAQDFQRAFTLADKAYLLTDELSSRPR